MYYKNVILTDDDLYECEVWLARLYVLNENIMDADEYTLTKLIRYEIDTRQRPHVLRRLIARHNKLRNLREKKELEDFIKNANRNREECREISEQTS